MMVLPLYQQKELERERENLIKGNKCNRGLVFNKYFDAWDSVEPGDKTGWMGKFCERPAGDKNQLTETTNRLIDLVDFAAGDFCCYRAAWRFVTGLGLNHPLENGMVWHHTLGVPYLPGSSVKGMVRAWVEQWLESSPQDTINRIFGPKKDDSNCDGEPADGVGGIIFFDALPLSPVRLVADVMTPHYQNYYGESAVPGDWMAPNPIPFLTVGTGQAFLFAIAPRKRDGRENRADLELVLQWLDQALENIGVGAKTAAGYGRFNRCMQTENKLRSALARSKGKKASKSASSIPVHLAGPIAEAMIKDLYDLEPDQFLQILKTKWLSKMLADETSAKDRQTIAQLLKNWYDTYRVGQWKKPNKRNTPVIEAIRGVLAG